MPHTGRESTARHLPNGVPGTGGWAGWDSQHPGVAWLWLLHPPRRACRSTSVSSSWENAFLPAHPLWTPQGSPRAPSLSVERTLPHGPRWHQAAPAGRADLSHLNIQRDVLGAPTPHAGDPMPPAHEDPRPPLGHCIILTVGSCWRPSPAWTSSPSVHLQPCPRSPGGTARCSWRDTRTPM